MKKVTIATALTLLLSATSAFAASQIDSQRAMDQQRIGAIRVQIPNGTPDQAVAALAQKAAQQGGEYFHITGLGTTGMGNSVTATAEIYK
ncbi:YdgH/BhsA/McbA-like domain containing protein [Edwardsiella tarda]|uniref:DUF1471 domain-containing protein n=1 Tax=Edwardsiella tarda ATCC 15947 = NBRC 105688 TaxID=667121 RepID=A0AC61TL71_EDWTA|nr:YdgH/BhsA/McbA-like domain containing protein [Edwardsiella tarda]AKH88730.1 DUF1471 domain-containing protein [Edwardsiella tarda]ATI65312.1 DUF1471 domain-containing protein [Edwardsiella tarda]UAL55623.1 DUF1471 domain-containing protein [Edwardsiella tarda]UCQ01319.1 DUF1471 domain-containing protein [Edwardsiella tarda ATCC 15947 = NBRC 105688]UCQ12514.1 DUF1471 domain-containing protein [Edwardsiella tarda]